MLQLSSMKLAMYAHNGEVTSFVGNLDVLDDFQIAKQKPVNSILFITATVFMETFCSLSLDNTFLICVCEVKKNKHDLS